MSKQSVWLINNPVIYKNGQIMNLEQAINVGLDKEDILQGYRKTISYSILSKHNVTRKINKESSLRLRFDRMASHDITYVGIIQTARASGLKKFDMPYVLTNCHNSLCAVGGTINEDDHMFGLSAARKYGGIFVPPNQAVIHTYMREMMSKCGSMILGSDSHTRYGALGTMAIGEGGPELVKQLLNRTYDIKYPQVIAVYLVNKPRHGVGPQDVALSIIKSVFKYAFVKNAVLEFIGPGIANLPIEYRNGIDVMTTETTCLSSIWETDLEVRDYYRVHGRLDDYSKLTSKDGAYYDKAIVVDLSKVVTQIAMPFHPSNAYDLQDVIDNPYDIFDEVEKQYKHLNNDKITFSLKEKIVDGKIQVDQGIIAGCAGGTYDNVYVASTIMKDNDIGFGNFTMSVYPSSQPIYYDLVRKGAIANLVRAGINVKSAFCGPCFGAGDVPANNAFSIRHTTRNFEHREGSKSDQGQISSIALMDSMSIACTGANKGILTNAMNVEFDDRINKYQFDEGIYKSRVFNSFGKANSDYSLQFGPNIKDWPDMINLPEHIVVEIASVLRDEVTTTDELIPSGETSSYRSNPLKLAEFTLSRKDPNYVPIAKGIYEKELNRRHTSNIPMEIKEILDMCNISSNNIAIGSGIYANKPGDGSAREQAASCQRVLGGICNFAKEYATKRYRSNLINWGMIPFISDDIFEVGDIVVIESIKKQLQQGSHNIDIKIYRNGDLISEKIKIESLTKDDISIIKNGCLINYYKKHNKGV